MKLRRAGFLVAVVGACLLAGCTGVVPTLTEPATTSAPPPATSASPSESSSDSPTPRLPEPAAPLPLADVAAFGSVATMNAGSNCTGTLIDTGVPVGPAYVLTNGHCVGDVGRSPQTTTVDEEWFGTAEFFRAEGNLDSTLSVDVVQLAYSTMRHTDTAVVRLASTLGELEKLGVSPVPLADDEPAEGTPVVNIGVPVQDLDHDEWVMRRGDCTLGSQHTLIEFSWLWFDVWSNDCPGIIQGSSGSPLFTLGADGAPDEIVGMINTTSWGVSAADGGACFLNRPCQVDGGVATMVEQTSYAQSVAGLGGCFDEDGEFALGRNCPLDVGSVWTETGSGGTFRGGSAPDATGRVPEASLVGSTSGTVRTALVPLGDARACGLPATYADARRKVLPKAGEVWDAVGVSVDLDLPEVEGRYLLCAVYDDDYDGAASVLFEVDRTPPIFDADADVEDIGGGTVIVRPHLNPPEITTVRFTWGAPDLDCSDTSTFSDFFIVPLTLEAADLPARYCLYGLDAAGNPTGVRVIDLP